MQLTSFLQDGVLTIPLIGELDHHRAKSYIASITGKIEAYNPGLCILDFTEVTFMDSSGIAVVINALRGMKAVDGQLRLEGIGHQPMRVFRASGIDKLIDIQEAVL